MCFFTQGSATFFYLNFETPRISKIPVLRNFSLPAHYYATYSLKKLKSLRALTQHPQMITLCKLFLTNNMQKNCEVLLYASEQLFRAF